MLVGDRNAEIRRAACQALHLVYTRMDGPTLLTHIAHASPPEQVSHHKLLSCIPCFIGCSFGWSFIWLIMHDIIHLSVGSYDQQPEPDGYKPECQAKQISDTDRLLPFGADGAGSTWWVRHPQGCQALHRSWIGRMPCTAMEHQTLGIHINQLILLQQDCHAFHGTWYLRLLIKLYWQVGKLQHDFSRLSSIQT